MFMALSTESCRLPARLPLSLLLRRLVCLGYWRRSIYSGWWDQVTTWQNGRKAENWKVRRRRSWSVEKRGVMYKESLYFFQLEFADGLCSMCILMKCTRILNLTELHNANDFTPIDWAGPCSWPCFLLHNPCHLGAIGGFFSQWIITVVRKPESEMRTYNVTDTLD